MANPTMTFELEMGHLEISEPRQRLNPIYDRPWISTYYSANGTRLGSRFRYTHANGSFYYDKIFYDDGRIEEQYAQGPVRVLAEARK